MARIPGVSRERAGLTARLTWAAIRRRLGKVPETWPIVAHRPWLLRGWGFFELALDRCRLVDAKLEELAQIKTSMLVGCEACIDVHSSLERAAGISEAQLRGLAHHGVSDAFSPLERLVLDYTMTRTPVDVSDDLFAALRTHLTDAQLVELTAAPERADPIAAHAAGGSG